MSTGQMNELLHELHLGKLDAAGAEFLAGARLSDLAADLRGSYPVLFQERMIGRKHEMSMARLIRFNLTPRPVSGSRFLSMQLRPVLQRCLLLSAYDDLVSEVTYLAGIHIRPNETRPRALVLKTGPGYKLDRNGDDWRIVRLKPKAVALTEEFLELRGWKFELLIPFMGQPARSTVK